MPSLLTPLWLAGLAALAVPFVLHLWNRRPTTIVRIGSLRGLVGPPGPRSLGARLDDIPLLLLRMSTLAALVLGLAGLAVRSSAAAAEGVSVLLVDPAVLADSLAVYSDPAVDSLRRSGLPVHLLAEGFPTAGDDVPPVRSGTDWALLSQLDDTLPPGSHVTVVSAMVAGRFGASRPTLRSEYHFRRLPSLDAAGLTGQTTNTAPADTTTVQVIVGEGYERDSESVSAAWSAAIEAHTGVPPRIVRSHPDSGGPRLDAQILIWLADQPVPASFSDRIVSGASLVEFTGGEPEEVPSPRILNVPTNGAPDGLFAEALWLRSAVPAGAPIITDGEGRPLVTVAALGAGEHYRVATRPGGDWSSMNLGSDLPELALLTLRGVRTGVDYAPIHPDQAGTRRRELSASDTITMQVLTPWMVLLAALLFSAERVIYHRQRRVGAV